MNPQPIELQNGDRLLLVSLNKTYDQSKAEGVYKREDLYEAVRKYWRVSKQRADKADYVLGIYKGIVMVVLKPTCEWQPVYESSDGTIFPNVRYMVEGEIIDDSPYLGKSVEGYPFGSGGSIAYVPKDKNIWNNNKYK